MIKSQLEVYARLKPLTSKRGSIAYRISPDKKSLEIQSTKHGMGASPQDVLTFQYKKVFSSTSKQEEVFKEVARPVIKSCLDGYNGTIFAYGQTGSGKTYTMSGAENWQERGIIPRVISYLFDEAEKAEKAGDFKYNFFISYLEIYNENGYDLLDRRHLDHNLENWNKIIKYDDDQGNTNLRNLLSFPCVREQDGIDLLMMGNYIRHVSATNYNKFSSRSHSIFTISIEAIQQETGTTYYSKMHLVDLAGSERLSKAPTIEKKPSDVSGDHKQQQQIPTETKNINLSLTYLEQVILALNEKSQGCRQHIPYRNSMLTTLLKDSLGGNSKTVMIANMSIDIENIEDSTTTARFSQRCSKLENEIKKNEKLDPSIHIKILEEENSKLKKELDSYKRFLKEEGGKVVEEEVKDKVTSFLNDDMEDLDVKTREESRACFRVIKSLYQSKIQDYVKELSFISEKLEEYDRILTTKTKKLPNHSESFLSMASIKNESMPFIEHKGDIIKAKAESEPKASKSPRNGSKATSETKSMSESKPNNEQKLNDEPKAHSDSKAQTDELRNPKIPSDFLAQRKVVKEKNHIKVVENAEIDKKVNEEGEDQTNWVSNFNSLSSSNRTKK